MTHRFDHGKVVQAVLPTGQHFFSDCEAQFRVFNFGRRRFTSRRLLLAFFRAHPLRLPMMKRLNEIFVHRRTSVQGINKSSKNKCRITSRKQQWWGASGVLQICWCWSNSFEFKCNFDTYNYEKIQTSNLVAYAGYILGEVKKGKRKTTLPTHAWCHTPNHPRVCNLFTSLHDFMSN